MMSALRPSRVFLICLASLVCLFVLSLLDACWLRGARGAAVEARRNLVLNLKLTDLCLFTEARYTRHPSQADLFSAFQDHPSGLEKFPSGSIVPPPAHLIAAHERLDRETTLSD